MKIRTGPERITIQLSKDHLSPRTFSVPTYWFSRLSAVVGLFFILLGLSVVWAVKNYLDSRSGNPARVRALEDEIAVMKTTQADLLRQIKEQTETLPPPAPSADSLGSAAQVKSSAPDQATLAIRLDPPNFSWEGNRLSVYFPIHYIRGDNLNQQGRIILLAKGPGRILAYPRVALNPQSLDELLLPQRGEFFSVSKFRETRALFDSVPARSDLTELEIRIYHSNGDLLYLKSHSIPQPGSLPSGGGG